MKTDLKIAFCCARLTYCVRVTRPLGSAEESAAFRMSLATFSVSVILFYSVES